MFENLNLTKFGCSVCLELFNALAVGVALLLILRQMDQVMHTKLLLLKQESGKRRWWSLELAGQELVS